MPEPLKASHVDSKTDPTVANQWDDETPKKQQIEEFYKTVDGMKVGLLTTIRDGVGPVARSMAVAKVRPLFIHAYLPINQPTKPPRHAQPKKSSKSKKNQRQ